MSANRFRGLTALSMVLLFSLTACSGQRATTQMIDGVLHVMNTEEPIRPNMKVELEELFRIGNDDDAGDDYIFTGIGGIAVDEQHRIFVQVTREDILRCYDADGEFIRTIGRQGQGPGELYYAQGVSFGADGNLWVPSAGSARIVIFTPEGDFVKNIAFSTAPPLLIQTTADGFMGLHQAVRQLAEGVAEVDFLLRRFNTEGDTLNTLFKASMQIDIQDLQLGGIAELQPLYTQDSEGRIWQCRPRADIYQLNVWNPDGTQNMVVEKDAAPIPKSEQEIEEERETVRRLIAAQFGGEVPPGLNLDYEPPTHRAFLGLPYYDPAGFIWAQVSREGTHDANAFDLYDMRGQFLKRIQFEGVHTPAFLAFVGDRLYCIELDPEEIPHVIVYRLNR